MALLNFKYGIFDRLPETQVPGTIYVTADEKAMYVDLPAVTGKDGATIAAGRIRLGSVIIHDSIVDFEPPYSAEAIYYSVQENALLRWNPTGGDAGTGAWVQINSVKAIDDKIDAVAKDIETLEGSITTLQGEDARIEGLITTETNRAKAEEERLAGLIGDADGGLTKALADEVTRAKAEEVRLAGLIGTNNSAITELQDEDERLAGLITDLTNNKVDKSAYNTKIGELEGLISDNATAAENAQKAADDAQADATANAGAITTLQNAVGDENSGLTKRVGDAETAITNLGNNKINVSDYNTKIGELNEAIAEAKKAGDDAQGTANTNAEAIGNIQDAIGENGLAGDISGLTTRVGTAEGNITNLQSRMGTAEGKITTAEGNITNLQGRMTTAEGKITTAEGAISTLQSDMSTAKGDITDLKQDVADLDGKIGTIPTDSGATNVIDYINGQFEAADAMQYKGGIEDLTDLPTTEVEAGHTYVVTADFIDIKDGETVSYYAGDLLIAAADQGTAASYTGGWTHVVTGYQASHNPALTGEGNKIKLAALEGDGVSLGEITVETDGSMLTATVANNKLSLGLEWGSF